MEKHKCGPLCDQRQKPKQKRLWGFERRLYKELEKISKETGELKEKDATKFLTICVLLSLYFYPIFLYFVDFFTTEDVVVHYIVGTCFFLVSIAITIIFHITKFFRSKKQKH